MDTTIVDFNTLTLLVAILGSTLTIVNMMIRQSGRHEDSIKALDTKVTVLNTKVAVLDGKVDALGARSDGVESRLDKLDDKFDRMGSDLSDARESLARIEGHLTAPGSFTMHGPRRGSDEDPPADEPADEQRKAR